MESKNNNVLQMFNDFMEANLIIKKIIVDCQPLGDDYNEESIINYQEKLLKSLQEIKSQFNKILNCFEDSIQNQLKGETLHNQVEKIFDSYKEKLTNCIPTYNNLKNLYQICFANMNKELIFKLRSECRGGGAVFNASLFPESFLKDATSINDLLHIFHICFINNEYKYRAIPVLEEKQPEFEETDTITLRGAPNKIAKQIYDNIPYKVGKTDIVAFPNGKIIMMIKDVGHATTIEIDDVKDDGRTWIRYFIPKICNLDMVKKIQGCGITYDDNHKPIFATGSIDTQNVAKDVTDLIEKIPTDGDMIAKDTNKRRV